MRNLLRLLVGAGLAVAATSLSAQDCLPDQIRCDGVCVDPMTDTAHCGVCGAACYADEACTAGVCLLVDSDNDGWSDQEENARVGTCDANDPNGFPKPEVCDGQDNDCDGQVDEGDTGGGLCPPLENSVCTGRTCANGDCAVANAPAGTPCGTEGAVCNGAGQCVLTPSSVAFARDFDVDGFVPPTDCNDHLSIIRPGAAEQCDGFDNNCNAAVDEGVTCEDNNACTSNDRCAGSCRNRARPDGTPCGTGGACVNATCLSIDVFDDGFEPSPPTR